MDAIWLNYCLFSIVSKHIFKSGDTAISRLPTHEDFVFSEILCVIISPLIRKRNVIFCSIDEKMIIAK